MSEVGKVHDLTSEGRLEKTGQNGVRAGKYQGIIQKGGDGDLVPGTSIWSEGY